MHRALAIAATLALAAGLGAQPTPYASLREVRTALRVASTTPDQARRAYQAGVALLEASPAERVDRQLADWYRLRADYLLWYLVPPGDRTAAEAILRELATHLEALRDALPEDISRDRVFGRIQGQAVAAVRLAAQAGVPALVERLIALREDLLWREDRLPPTRPRSLALERTRDVWMPRREWAAARAALAPYADDLDAQLLLLEVALASGADAEAEALRKKILAALGDRGLALVWTGTPGVVLDPGERVVPAGDHPVALILPSGPAEGGVTLTFPHRDLESVESMADHVTRWEVKVPLSVPAAASGRWAELRFDRAAWNACLERWDARPSRAWEHEDVPVEWQRIACRAAMDWARWGHEASPTREE